MRNAKRWLAAVMSAAMVFSSGGVATLSSSIAVYAESYDYTASGTVIPDQPWTGEIPDLSKVDALAQITVEGNLTLTRGTDYTVEADTANAGDATAIFTCIGKYEGKTIAPISFQIKEAEEEATYAVTLDKAAYVYDGDALTEYEVADAATVIKNGNERLEYEDGYDIVLTADNANKSDNGTAGEKYNLVFKVGEKEIYKDTITIAKKDLATVEEVSGETAEAYVYDGTAKEATFSSVTVEDYEDVLAAANFTVSGFENNINATTETSKATATVTATAANKNYTGSAKVTFEIAPAEIGAATKLVVSETKSVVYNGKDQKPEVSVKAYFEDKVGAKEIPAADYEIVYPESSKDVSTEDYTVTIKPSKTGNLVEKEGESVASAKAYAITQASLKDVTIAPIDDYIPANTDVTKDNSLSQYFKITLGDYELVQGTDYDAVYANENWKKVDGAASIKLTGKGNFKEEATINYTAKAEKFVEKYTSAIDSLVYDGSAKRPSADKLGELTGKASDGSEVTLEKDQYMVLDWANNVNATTEESKATATIEGKGEFEGQKATVEFEIAPMSIEDYDATVTGIKEGSYYEGQELTGATVTLKQGSKEIKLTADDYTLTVDTIEEGYLTSVEVAGKGNYEDSVWVDVKVASNIASLNNAVVEGTIPAGMADYSAETLKKYITVKIDGNAVASDAYTLNDSDVTAPAKIEVGSEITVKLTQGEVLAGTKTATLKVAARDLADLADAIAAEEGTYIYNGTAIESGVAIDDTKLAAKDVTAFVEKTDYTVAYKDNVDAGTATVTLTGKGNYTGSVSKTFKIEKAELTEKDLVITKPAASARQFKVGAAEDLSAQFGFKYAGEIEKEADYVALSASDYTLKLVEKQEVKATDKVADGITIKYIFTVNKDSKNFQEDKKGFEVSYDLVAKTVTDAKVTLEKDQLEYVSDNITDYDITKLGKITVEVDGAALKEGTDYTLKPAGSGKLNTELGANDRAPYVEVTFAGNYAGIDNTAKVKVVSKIIDITQIKLVAPTAANLVYSGYAIIPTVNDIGKDKLPEGSYVIVYSKDGKILEEEEPVNVGTYKATVKATAEYGSAEGESIEYTITPEKISAAKFADLHKDIFVGDDWYEDEDPTVAYAGEATATPALNGMYADEFEVVSFTKDWDGETASKGTATIALKADSNYVFDGTAEKTFSWRAGWLDENKLLAMFKIDDQTYTGEALTPAVTPVDADASADWVTVEYYENNVNAAEKTAKAYVKIQVPNTNKKYYGSTEGFIVFTINPSPIGQATFGDIADASYNGKEQKPAIEIKNADGSILTLDKDYKVEYTNNKEVGAATATITGLKNYAGTVVKAFNINKGASKVTVKAKTATYNGKAVTSNNATVTGSKGKVTYTYYSDAACKKAVKTVKDAGTYYVKASVAADANYEAATSAAIKITVKQGAQKVKKVTPAKKTVKAGKSFKLKATNSVKGGKATFKKSSGNKKITVSKAGKVTVKKGLKKGTYKVKVKVTLAKTKNYKASKAVTKTITVKVK